MKRLLGHGLTGPIIRRRDGNSKGNAVTGEIGNRGAGR
jgi:hypothetical protein